MGVGRANPVWVIALFIAGVAAAGALLPEPPDRDPAPLMCRAELRSWVVAARGRHLYLDLLCPPPYDHLSGRVEFGQASLRWDYIPPVERSRAERVTRAGRGGQLSPPFGLGFEDNRLEAVFFITPEQAACLQRDRMWASRYMLVGTNSNSAMRATLSQCGCETPAHVAAGSGLLGEFPGIDADLGDEIAPDEWHAFGVPGPTDPGPTPLLGALD